jgi:hypothetical protein
MESYDSTFFEDEGGYDENNNDAEVQEDDVNSSSDLDDDEASPKLSAKQQAAAAAAAQQQAAAAAQQQQDTGNIVFSFTLDRSDCQFGPNRTAEQKAREGTWMVVVLRDLEQLVAELRVSAAESDSNPDSIDAETGDLSHGSYAVIDGVRLAASDAMNIRLKRDCALINTAIKSDGANNYITPEAAELLTAVAFFYTVKMTLWLLA